MITLGELVFLLNSLAGCFWAGNHKCLPHIFLHLFLCIQLMLAPFVALGNIHEYRAAILKGDPIDATTYKQASTMAALQVTKVNNIIHNRDLGAVFSCTPLLLCVSFTPTPRNLPPPSGGHGSPDLSAPVPRKAITLLPRSCHPLSRRPTNSCPKTGSHEMCWSRHAPSS